MIFVGKGGKKGWAWGWGVFLLLVAALVLANQFGGFLELGFWSIAVAALAVAFFIKCIVDLHFAALPIPIAALYYIFQVQLDLPVITFWPLALVTVLVTIGLHVLIPHRRFRRGKKIDISYSGDNKADVIINNVIGYEDAGEERTESDEGNFVEGGSDNNPSISVQFGGGSRYLHADRLETVELDCSFGGLEVYFDHVTLSPNGAEAFLNCKFGSIELYVPKNWRIIDNMNVSLADMEINNRRAEIDENSPVLKVSGNVSFGSVEINRIKG